MEWRADMVSNVAEVAASGAEALREESKAARELLADLAALSKAYESSARPSHAPAGRDATPAFSNARDQDFKASPWENAAADAKQAADAAKSNRAEQDKGGESAGKAGEKAAKASKAGSSAAKDAALGLKDLTKGAVAYGAALAGLHSLGDLASMAIGWRALGQLQMVSWKATMDLRNSVRGVDAPPLVRAAQALEKNLSKSSVTGNALSGILTRGFNGFFGAVERLEPVVEAVFQGIVLGALEGEIAFQRVRGALAPTIVDLEEMVGGVDGITVAAQATGTAFKVVGGTIVAVASGLNDAYQAAKALNAEVAKLTGGAGVLDTVGNALTGGAGAAGKALGEKAGPAGKGPLDGVPLLPLGDTAGKALATGAVGLLSVASKAGETIASGLVGGMDAGAAGVEAAGRRLGAAGVAGARAGADAHSPSRKTYKLGDDMAEGDIQGMRARAGDVERAAAEVLAPKVKPGSGAAAAALPAAQGPVTITMENHFHGIDPAKQADLSRAVDMLHGALRSALVRAGVPLPGVT